MGRQRWLSGGWLRSGRLIDRKSASSNGCCWPHHAFARHFFLYITLFLYISIPTNTLSTQALTTDHHPQNQCITRRPFTMSSSSTSHHICTATNTAARWPGQRRQVQDRCAVHHPRSIPSETVRQTRAAVPLPPPASAPRQSPPDLL